LLLIFSEKIQLYLRRFFGLTQRGSAS
jgi:hypothetical protein